MRLLRNYYRQAILSAVALFLIVAGVCLYEARNTSYESLPGSPVENFRLHDHQGISHELYRLKNANAVVIISHGNGCPIVRNSLQGIQALNLKYKNQEVEFFLLNANSQDTRDKILAEVEGYDIEVPILKDESQTIAHSLKFKRTAEALIIDPKTWNIVYRGAIDDQFDYGAKRAVAKNLYLDEALDAFLSRKPIKKGAAAKGCLISYDQSFEKTAEISYENDISPILINRCMNCHTEHGPGPWAMSDYTQVKGWARMIREVLRTQRMPPWQADPQFGRFETDISITPEESRSLILWIEKGAQRGNERDPLVAAYAKKIQSPAQWPLGKPDLILDLEEQHLPASGLIDYRYIKVPSPVKENVWLRAVDLSPSNKLATHHAGAFVRLPKENLLDKTNIFKDNFLAGYLPGAPPIIFPKGTAKLLHKKAELVFQFHYNATGKPEVDRPRLALYFSKDSNVKELVTGSIFNRDLKILPYQKNYKIEGDIAFDSDVMVYELIPHMHYRGKSMKYEVEYPDGKRETLLSVSNYNFNFQWLYRFEKPRHFPAGSRIHCEAVFDNSSENPLNPDPSATVTWGEQTSQEMFLCLVNYTKI